MAVDVVVTTVVFVAVVATDVVTVVTVATVNVCLLTADASLSLSSLSLLLHRRYASIC